MISWVQSNFSVIEMFTLNKCNVSFINYTLKKLKNKNENEFIDGRKKKRQAVETRGRTFYNAHNQQKIHLFNQPQILKTLHQAFAILKKSRQSPCLHENMKSNREERDNRQK